MRKRQRQVFVEVSSTRCEIAVIEDGVVLGQRSARMATPENDSQWATVVHALEDHVTKWVSELGVTGCQVSVVYSGPDTTASLYDCPVSAGEQRAKLAAKIAMTGTVSFPLEQNAHAEICLYKETASPDDEQPQIRTLAIADTEATILSLSMALERAGLHPVSFVPASGASLAAAVECLVKHAEKDTPHAVLWIGEHSSVITAGECGRVSLARLIPVGSETFVEALSRPISSADQSSAPLMEGNTAREFLFTTGLPSADCMVESDSQYNAHVILPLIQPAVQRLTVELKQSIRFGLDRDIRSRTKLIVCGPGSKIRGLGDSIAFGAALDMSERNPQLAPETTGVHGDIYAVIELGARAPSLVPQKYAADRVLRKTKKAIWVGAAMAFLAIGADSVESLRRSAAAQKSLEHVNTHSATADSLADQTMQLAFAARQGLLHAQSREHKLLESAPSYAAVLEALSTLTPDQVSLTEVAFVSEGKMAQCAIRGWAVADEEVSETERFSEYTSLIRACPLIAETKLGETRRTEEHDGVKLSFSMTLELVTIPFEVLVVQAEASGDPTP